MNEMRVRPAWVAKAFLVGLLIGMGSIQIFVPRAEKKVRDEAVKANHARYKVVDEKGTTQFEWLPAPKTVYKVVDPQGNTEFEDGPKPAVPVVPAKP